MKLKLLVMAIALICKSVYAQTPQTYVSFQSNTLSLYSWQGNKTMLLSGSNTLNPVTMNNWVLKMDAAYNFYELCTGQQPAFITGVTYINNRATIADVPSTCGAGCGYLGATGIELQNSFFMNMYNYIDTQNLYDQIPFYEWGRNFWFYDSKLKYQTNDPIVTGYAVFMRFMAMEAANVQGAPFNSWTFTQFKNNVINLLPAYMANTSLNWGNTLGIGQGVPGSGLGATDLFASFCFYMRDHYCGSHWVENIWKYAAQRPNAITTQDAVDNFIIASSQAANSNLAALFQYWKWPVSSSAISYLNSLNLGVTLALSASSSTMCSGASATLQVSGAGSYTWSNGASQPSVVVTPSSTSVYSVTGAVGTCTYSSSITVSVVPQSQLTVSAFPSDSVCAGMTATLSASGNYSNYSWSGSTLNSSTLAVNINNNLSYTVTGSGFGCSSMKSGMLHLRSNPVSTLGLKPSYCDNPCNGTINISSNQGKAPYSYFIPGTNCTTFPCTSLCPGLYNLNTTDAAGCKSFNIFSIDCNETTDLGNSGDINHEAEIYPNPAAEQFMIKFPGVFECKIYSLAGQTVIKTVSGNNEAKIETNLPDGIYLVEFVGSNGVTVWRKLLVKN